MAGTVPDLAQDLRHALLGDGLRLVFQPEYSLHDGSIVAVEALLRWRHATLGELEPTDFIPAAESSDTIVEIGSWVLESALTEYAVWAAQLPELDLVLRLNASTHELIRPDFSDLVAAALDRHGVPASSVCIEMTETGPRRDVRGIAETVRGLQTLGVSVALDDLSAGYSTLSMLRTYPVDIVKIDRGLVSGIDSDHRAATIVAAVIALARALDISVVAEGIETRGELEEVLRLGCDRGQGYLFSLPVPSGDVVRQLVEHGRYRRDG